MKWILSTATGLALLAATLLHADQRLRFSAARNLSEEAPRTHGGASPGRAAAKARIVALQNTAGGERDGRLLVVYADANCPQARVWGLRGGEHAPRDVFARWSDDGGSTWSDPADLSRCADRYSALTDWDGDGRPEPYWGDVAKPTIFASGDSVVVTWTATYCPEPDWEWGRLGESAVQGRVVYPDPSTPAGRREVPYAGVFAAISTDGGTSWTFGDAAPPLQITYGRRDALGDLCRGAGGRWVLVWQEDALGLQPGEAEGPGDGGSGARVTKGTDVWYTFTSDLAAEPLALRANRVPVSDQSRYDRTGLAGFPGVGPPGSLSRTGASRPMVSLVKEGKAFRAVVAYEETKGEPEQEGGKAIRYHAFPYDLPPGDGDDEARAGTAGTALSDPLENARRVRLVTQEVSGVDPAIVVLWRQGREAHGAPADVLLRTCTSLDPEELERAVTLNVSGATPSATHADLYAPTWEDPLENAMAHRAVLRGSTIVFGCSYTWNGALVRDTDYANYDFWVRRSIDGGLTWSRPRNVSRLSDQHVNVREPRLVAPPGKAAGGLDVFVVAWGTETNVFPELARPEPLDLFVQRTVDGGATFGRPHRLGGEDTADQECQLRLDATGELVQALWIADDGTSSEVAFSSGSVETIDSPSGGCVARSGAAGDPLLAVLLAVAVASIVAGLVRAGPASNREEDPRVGGYRLA